MDFFPLKETLPIEEILPDLVKGKILLVGRAEGYLGILDPEQCLFEPKNHMVQTIVAQDVLTKHEQKSIEFIYNLLSHLEHGGIFILIEQSIPLKRGGKGLITKGLEWAGFTHGPEEITKLFLMLGLKEITQLWPQGIRSFVLTYGKKPFYDI